MHSSFPITIPKWLIQATFFARSLCANSIWCARQGMEHTTGSSLSTVYKVQPFSFNHVCDTDQMCSSMKALLLPLSLNALQSKMMAFLGLLLLFPEKSGKQVSTHPLTSNSVPQSSMKDKLSKGEKCFIHQHKSAVIMMFAKASGAAGLCYHTFEYDTFRRC